MNSTSSVHIVYTLHVHHIILNLSDSRISNEMSYFVFLSKDGHLTFMHFGTKFRIYYYELYWPSAVVVSGRSVVWAVNIILVVLESMVEKGNKRKYNQGRLLERFTRWSEIILNSTLSVHIVHTLYAYHILSLLTDSWKLNEMSLYFLCQERCTFHNYALCHKV